MANLPQTHGQATFQCSFTLTLICHTYHISFSFKCAKAWYYWQAQTEVFVTRKGWKPDTPGSPDAPFSCFLHRPSWFRTSTAILRTVRRQPTLLAVSETFISNVFLLCFLKALVQYKSTSKGLLQPSSLENLFEPHYLPRTPTLLMCNI